MTCKAFGYWIPVAGAEEHLLHFGVGGTFACLE